MFWLLLTILLLTLLFFKGLKIFNYLDHVAGIMEMIPGPTPYPFVGNIFQFGLKPDEYPKKILQYCRKYEFQGFRSLVFFQYHVMLSDPAEIQNMLTSSSLLHKEHLYSFLRPWLGDGLLTSSSARWLKHHKLYVPAFERRAVDGYLQVVHKTCQRFISCLSERANDDAAMFDVQPLVSNCTLDIAVENATGIAFNTLTGGSSECHSAIQDLCDVIQERTFSIVKRFDTLFQLTPQYWIQRAALKTLKRVMGTITKQRREMLQKAKNSNEPLAQRPFLDFLLEAKLDGRKLKEREIFEELSTFIFTSHNPTAAAISFTLYTLSRHADIQQKAYLEQKEIFNTLYRDEDVHPNCEQLNRMSYLEAVIRETLRLYPSVPLIARTNRKPIDINGTKIAKRTTVIMCLIAMGYNEKYFDEPCKFRPERWHNNGDTSSNGGESAGLGAFKSVPFSAGPRRCIAEEYAMFELKLLLSAIIRNFEILPAVKGLPPGINDHSRVDCVPQSKYDPVLNIRITLKSENGIQLRLRRRN